MGVGIFHLPQIEASVEYNTSEWQRPADWLPMPTNITETDQIFVGLHAVIENSDNYCAFLFTTSAGQYQVDWGDGNITFHNSGTIAQYQYNFASISNSTISSRGYRQVIIKVTPVSGNLLTCNFQQRYITTPVQNQAYSSGFLDCILSMPNASSGQSITFGGTTIRHSYCEKVDIKTIGNATSMGYMFYNCFTLQSVPLFNTINVISMASMFQYCQSLQSVPLFNTTNVTSMYSMFANCYSLQSVPLFNTSNVTIMSNMFNSCSSLQSVPLFFTANVTSMFNMFRDCSSLQSVPQFKTGNVTNMGGMFANCFSLNFIPPIYTEAITSDFTAFVNNSNSLNQILMNFNRTVALQNCQLSKDSLVEIFTNLTNRTSTTSATIDITGNWGSSALTSADRAIATNKNWVIIG